MPTFDIQSEIDHHELANAADQVKREISQRFDFKNTPADITHDDESITLIGENDFQIQQIETILMQRLSKRGIDIQAVSAGDIISHQSVRKQTFTLIEGIDQSLAKTIQGIIKTNKLKVQAQLQEKKMRISGKKRDDLQSCIQALKEASIKQPLQFVNFRD